MAPNRLIPRVDPKNQHTGMAFLHEEEDNHNHTDEKKGYGAEDRYSLEPQRHISLVSS